MNRTGWVAFLMSCLAAAAALVSGFVSDAESTTYRWERGSASNSQEGPFVRLDSSLSFTPLLLSAHVPQRIEVRWTCDQRIADSSTSTVVVGTSKGGPSEGLYVVSSAPGTFQLSVGGRTLIDVVTPRGADKECVYRAIVERERGWVLMRGNESLAAGASEPPLVTGLKTELHYGQSHLDAFVIVEITTVPHGPSASSARTVLRLLALILLTSSAALVLSDARSNESHRWTIVGHLKKRAAFRSRPWRFWLDHVLVTMTLIAWWLVGPALFDDGWVSATVQNFANDGVFSSYYDTSNAALPLGYVHDIIIAGFAAVSTALLWLRIPALLAGLATWLVVRSIVDQGVRNLRIEPGFGVHLTTASMFLLSWVSWNNTLRPEPMLALLVAVSMWAAFRFVSRPDPRMFLLGSVAVALALSIHPAGVVSAAPLILAIPSIVAWVKAQPRARTLPLGASILIGVAVLILAVLSVGDAAFWSAARGAFTAEEAHSGRFLNELARYSGLFDAPYSNSVRQLSVVLPFVAPLMFILRRRSQRRPESDIPVLTFVIAILLLALTPSKWIWHFGSLTPLAAAAVGMESNRWRNERSDVSKAGAVLVFATVTAISIAVWDGWFGWNLLALSKLEDLQRVSGVISNPAALLTAVLVGSIAVSIAINRRVQSQPSVAHSMHDVSAWLAPITALFAVGISILVFAIDGLLLSPGWSLARQNLSELRSSGCGAAEDVIVHSDEQAIPLASTSLTQMVESAVITNHSRLQFEPYGVYQRSLGNLPPVEADTWGSWISGDKDTGWFASPWYSVAELDIGEREGLVVTTAGRPSFGGNSLSVQVASKTDSGIRYGPLMSMSLDQDTEEWQTATLASVVLDESVLAVRLIAVDASTDAGGWLAFSSPYFYGLDQTLDELVSQRGGPILISPQIRMYFPCFVQPEIKRGKAEIPSVILSVGGWPIALPGSPYHDLDDIANLEPLKTTWTNRDEPPQFDVILVDARKEN